MRTCARPVLVDIDSATFNLAPSAVVAALTPPTKAILPVHLYGWCADMDEIVAIAANAGVPGIEDACQSIGATYKASRPARSGTWGVSCFSPQRISGRSATAAG